MSKLNDIPARLQVWAKSPPSSGQPCPPRWCCNPRCDSLVLGPLFYSPGSRRGPRSWRTRRRCQRLGSCRSQGRRCTCSQVHPYRGSCTPATRCQEVCPVHCLSSHRLVPLPSIRHRAALGGEGSKNCVLF